MRKEQAYVISRRTSWRSTTQNEYYIAVRKGRWTVGEVWCGNNVMKSAYDQRGRSVCPFSITDPGTGLAASTIQVVAYMILLNAYDVKTATEWYVSVAEKLRMPTNVPVTLKKSDLFALILEMQRIRSLPDFGRTGVQG